MRIAHYERIKCGKPLRIIITVHDGGDGGLLIEDLQKKYFPGLKDRGHQVEYNKRLENRTPLSRSLGLGWSVENGKEMNQFFQSLNDSNKKTLVFIDEVELEAPTGKQDFSMISAPSDDLEFFIAVRPHIDMYNSSNSMTKKYEYEICLPDNSKIMAEQLNRRHRNCSEIQELSLHMLYTRKWSSENMHLKERKQLSKDTPPPNGGTPLWIGRDENFPFEKLLRFILAEYTETGQKVTLITKNPEIKEAAEALNKELGHDGSAKRDCKNMRLVSNINDMRGCEDDVVISPDFHSCHELVTRAREMLVIITFEGK